MLQYYTKIEHNDLFSKLQALFTQLDKMENNRGTLVGRKGTHFQLFRGNIVDSGKQKWEKVYSLDDLLQMINFLINNTYITLADSCWKQAIGIPMGTNCGVNLVDFYLTKYELDFMVQLKQGNHWELLRIFCNTMRYLDDILAIDNPLFVKLLYTDCQHEGIKGIYPRGALTIERVSRAEKVQYMDASISRYSGDSKHYMDGKLFTRTFDKRRFGKFAHLNLLRYTAAESLILPSVGLNIITTQMHRFVKLDMRLSDFVNDTVQTFYDLIHSGFDRINLLSKIRRFLLTFKSRLLYGVTPIYIYRLLLRKLKRS